jgi:hypothetical protein
LNKTTLITSFQQSLQLIGDTLMSQIFAGTNFRGTLISRMTSSFLHISPALIFADFADFFFMENSRKLFVGVNFHVFVNKGSFIDVCKDHSHGL